MTAATGLLWVGFCWGREEDGCCWWLEMAAAVDVAAFWVWVVMVVVEEGMLVSEVV